MNYVLPGMGATQAMYQGPWRQLKATTFLDWPKGFTGESITELANHSIEAHRIQPTDRLIGSSLGGMVACEIANQIGSKKLILVGSAKHPSEITGLLHRLKPLIPLTPIAFLQQLAASVPADLVSMFRQADPDFIRNMCQAILDWPGLAPPIQPFRIHGRRDPVIPAPTKTDAWINGGHLIAITHANECVAALRPQLHTHQPGE